MSKPAKSLIKDDNITVECTCGFTRKYETSTIAKRMQKVHMIKYHGALAESAPKIDGVKTEKTEAAKPQPNPQPTPQPQPKPQPNQHVKKLRQVNFCPCCGTNLSAINVAINL